MHKHCAAAVDAVFEKNPARAGRVPPSRIICLTICLLQIFLCRLPYRGREKLLKTVAAYVNNTFNLNDIHVFSHENLRDLFLLAKI